MYIISENGDNNQEEGDSGEKMERSFALKYAVLGDVVVYLCSQGNTLSAIANSVKAMTWSKSNFI